MLNISLNKCIIIFGVVAVVTIDFINITDMQGLQH